MELTIHLMHSEIKELTELQEKFNKPDMQKFLGVDDSRKISVIVGCDVADRIKKVRKMEHYFLMSTNSL